MQNMVLGGEVEGAGVGLVSLKDGCLTHGRAFWRCTNDYYMYDTPKNLNCLYRLVVGRINPGILKDGSWSKLGTLPCAYLEGPARSDIWVHVPLGSVTSFLTPCQASIVSQSHFPGGSRLQALSKSKLLHIKQNFNSRVVTLQFPTTKTSWVKKKIPLAFFTISQQETALVLLINQTMA